MHVPTLGLAGFYFWWAKDDNGFLKLQNDIEVVIGLFCKFLEMFWVLKNVKN
jgi:hypothetical protein